MSIVNVSGGIIGCPSSYDLQITTASSAQGVPVQIFPRYNEIPRIDLFRKM